MTHDELLHLKRVLEAIKNPDSNVALASAYVAKDIALRERQSRRERLGNLESRYDIFSGI